MVAGSGIFLKNFLKLSRFSKFSQKLNFSKLSQNFLIPQNLLSLLESFPKVSQKFPKSFSKVLIIYLKVAKKTIEAFSEQ